jgi:hypothetical protein
VLYTRARAHVLLRCVFDCLSHVGPKDAGFSALFFAIGKRGTKVTCPRLLISTSVNVTGLPLISLPRGMENCRSCFHSLLRVVFSMVRCIPRSCDNCPSVIPWYILFYLFPQKIIQEVNLVRFRQVTQPSDYWMESTISAAENTYSTGLLSPGMNGDSSCPRRASCREYKLKASDLSCKQSAPSQSQYNALQTAFLLLYAKSNLSPPEPLRCLNKPLFFFDVLDLNHVGQLSWRPSVYSDLSSLVLLQRKCRFRGIPWPRRAPAH